MNMQPGNSIQNASHASGVNPSSEDRTELVHEPADQAEGTLSGDERTLLAGCFDGGTEEIVRASSLCLKKRLNKTQVLKLVGSGNLFAHQIRDHQGVVAYSFAPSQVLEFCYDKNGIVTNVLLNGQRVLSDGSISASDAIQVSMGQGTTTSRLPEQIKSAEK